MKSKRTVFLIKKKKTNHSPLRDKFTICFFICPRMKNKFDRKNSKKNYDQDLFVVQNVFHIQYIHMVVLYDEYFEYVSKLSFEIKKKQQQFHSILLVNLMRY
jgi:hypothetical protein